MFSEFKKTLRYTNDILRGVNATVWGGVENSEKIGKAFTTGISGADVVIGTSHALEDFACNDPICGTIDVIGSLSSSLGLILGNIPSTKKYTTYTTAVTVGCRSVRAYCKHFGTYWGCTVSVISTAKEVVTNKILK